MRWGTLYYNVCATRAGHCIARSTLRGLRRLGWFRELRAPLDALELDHPLTAGLMRLWTCIHWSSGDGMMPPRQLLTLYRLAATWPGEGDVVELGAWVGLTTTYLAAACRLRGSGRVCAVDTFTGIKEGGTHYPSIHRFQGHTLTAFNDQLSRAGVADRVDTLVGLTSDAVHDYARNHRPPIRMLLIDADHSYNGVRNDFLLWSPLVAPGGIVVFHDYDMPDVRRFIHSEVMEDRRFSAEPGLVTENVFAVTRRHAPDRPASRVDPDPKPRDARLGRETVPPVRMTSSVGSP